MTEGELQTPETKAAFPSNRPRKRREGRTRNVVFVCPNNAATSIMAEALLRQLGGENFRAFSAGSDPSPELSPVTIEVLKGRRIWQEDLRPKSCQELLALNPLNFDFVIGIGEHWPQGLPSVWPGDPNILQWHISEPITDGDAAEKKRAFKKTLTEVETRIRLFVLVNEKEALKRPAA